MLKCVLSLNEQTKWVNGLCEFDSHYSTMNKLNKIYKELQLIEEFESNFRITKRSKQRREYLLQIINK